MAGQDPNIAAGQPGPGVRDRSADGTEWLIRFIRIGIRRGLMAYEWDLFMR
jgi:hypothetical protein